jgi:hypothetical protein
MGVVCCQNRKPYRVAVTRERLQQLVGIDGFEEEEEEEEEEQQEQEQEQEEEER